MIIDNKQKQLMFHVLRNPWGWSEEVVHEMRLKAADELERLYKVENVVEDIVSRLIAKDES